MKLKSKKNESMVIEFKIEVTLGDVFIGMDCMEAFSHARKVLYLDWDGDWDGGYIIRLHI